MSQIPLPREAEHEVADTNTPVPEVEIYPDSGDESPTLSRTISHGSSSSSTSPGSDDWEIFPPLDKITVFDVLDQLALPQRLEKLNKTVLTQREKLRKRQDTFTKTYRAQKDKVMRKAEVEKLVKKYNDGLDKVLDMWNDTKVVSMTEKASFVVGVSNVFITGYLMAGYP